MRAVTPIKKSLYPRTVEEQHRFLQLLNIFLALERLIEQGEQKLPTFKALLYDIWLSFYAVDKVHLIEGDEGDDFHTQFLNELLKTEQYSNWSLLTQYDDLLSLITTLSIAENVLKELEKQERYQQLVGHFGDRKQRPSVKSINIQRMMETSKEQTKELKEALVQMHGIEGKKLQETPLKEQLALANTLQHNDSVKKIAELTGRFKRIAFKKYKSKEKITMQRKDVTLGQEIARLLPIELAGFVMPQSKLAFYRKFVEHETLVFDQKGKESSGRGPLVLCMDESSSMSFLKEESKAFCLALLQIAKKQKRDFAIIPFATTTGEILVFEKGCATVEEITKFSDSFLGGGTNYEKALSEALDILAQSKFKRADLLFVTDGTSFLSRSFIELFNEAKKKRKFSCTSIVLTNLYNAVDISVVGKFSDSVIEAKDLFSADKAFNAIL